MELSKLTFVVESDQLKTAADRIKQLATAMSQLNKVQTEEEAAAERAVKQKIREEKARERAARQLEKEAAALEKKRQAEEAAATSTKNNLTVLERQQSILEFMTQGFSKGQSTVLAYAKASGALAQELTELGGVLQTQRKLIGGDVFDKSMSGLIALKNQYGEIREAIRQYNSDVELTRNQTRELARDKERIIEKMKLEGATFSQIKDAIRSYNQVYTEQAVKVNSLINVEKERERSLRDRANAIRNVQAAEERLFSSVAHLNNGVSENTKINERAALAIGSYERNLRLAGITGEVAAAKLQKFKQAQMQIAEADMANRARYVSRGIGVQMGDVAVSLAGGMNPLLVMIQQGDQIRGLIQQSGLEAAAMAKIMNQAFGSIVASFRDVGIAMGSFVVGGLETAGKAVLEFVKKTSLLNKATETWNKFFPDSFFTKLLNNFVASKGAMIAFGVAAGFAATALAAVPLAMFQSAKANDALLITLNTTGAALGMTAKQVSSFAEANNKYSTSANELKKAIGVLASEGFKQKDMLGVVTDAAQRYAHVTGQSLDEIVKGYAKVAKDPIDSLVKLAKETGNVELATLQLVQELLNAGDTAKATEIAIESYASAQVKSARDIESSLSPLSKLYLDIKKEATDAWDGIVEFGNSALVVNGIKGITISVVSLVGVLKDLAIGFNFVLDALNPLTALPSVDKLFSDLAKSQAGTTESLNRIALGGDVGKPSGGSDLGGSFSFAQQEMEKFYTAEEKYIKKILTYQEQIAKLDDSDPAQLKLKQQYIDLIRKESAAYEEAVKKKGKSDNVTTSEYSKVLERISDLNIENTKTTEDYSKAQQLILDLFNNPAWATFDDIQKRDIANKIEAAHAIEMQSKKYKEQEKALESLYKMQSQFETDSTKRDTEISANTSELEFQYSLLGKSSEEIRKMTIEYNVQAKTAAIINKYEVERKKLAEEYNNIMSSIYDPVARLAAEKEYQNNVNKLNEQQEQDLTNARKQGNLEVLKDYEKEWKEIQGVLSDVMYEALTGKGKDAAKKLRSYIEDQLKKRFIMPAIDIVINAALNTVGFGTPAQQGAADGDIFGQLSKIGEQLGTGSGLNSFGSTGSGLYGKFATSSIGQALGLSQTNAALTTASGSVLAPASTTLTSTGASVGNFISSYGGYFDGVLKLVQGDVKGAAFSAAGAAIGSIIPGVGTAIGSVVGNIVGGLFGGSKEKYKAANINMSGDVSSGRFSPTSVDLKRVDSNAVDPMKGVLQAYSDKVISLLSAFDIDAENFKVGARLRQRRSSDVSLGGFSVSLMGQELWGGDNTMSNRYETHGNPLEAFEKFAGDILTKGMKLAVAASPLPEIIKKMFEPLADENVDVALATVINSANAMKQLGTSLTEFLDTGAIQEYQQRGEALHDTLGRLSASLALVNNMFDDLGWNYYSLNLQGADTASMFAEMLGGLESTQAILSSYYDNYYSEEEKRANTIKHITRTLVDAGAEITEAEVGSATKEQFRQVTEGLIATRGATDPLVIALLKVQDAFASVAVEVEEASIRFGELLKEFSREVLNAEMQNLDAQYKALTEVGTAELEEIEKKRNAILEKEIINIKEGINAGIVQSESAIELMTKSSDVFKSQIDSLRTVIRDLTRLSASISDTVSALRNVIPIDQTKVSADLNQMLSRARGGILPTNEDFGSLRTQLEANKTSSYSSFVDFSRDQLVRANKLEELNSYVKKELSSAEKQVVYAETQIELISEQIELYKSNISSLNDQLKELNKQTISLDELSSSARKQIESLNRQEISVKSQLAKAEDQYNALKGINNSVITMTSALNNFANAVISAQNATTANNTFNPAPSTSQVTPEQHIKSLFNLVGFTGSKSLDQSYVDYFLRTSLTGDSLTKYMLSEIVRYFGGDSAYADIVAKSSSLLGGAIPKFADGGYYSGGLALVGEEGPELINFNQPGMVYNAAQSANLMRGDDSEVVAELRALRSEVSALKAEVKADVSANTKTAKLLERVTPDGRSLNVKVLT